MTAPIPPGKEGLIPHLVCSPCAEAIEFYKQAFGAKLVFRLPAPDGERIMHAEIHIGGQPVLLVDDFPEFCGGQSSIASSTGGKPVTIHRYVEDVDAAIKQAIDAGATAQMPVSDMFWGDRYGMVVDPYGHQWSIATHMNDLTPQQMAAGMDEAFKQMPAN